MSRPFIDLTGVRFGLLTVLNKGETRPSGYYMWDCVCDCGNKTSVQNTNIKRVKSCGCLLRTANGHNKMYFNGELPEYGTWKSMNYRCYNPKQPAYVHYGARGITVCDRWRNSFDAFLEDMGKKPSPSHSIDRIDVNGNYEPGNCRWATPREQNLNKRTSVANR